MLKVGVLIAVVISEKYIYGIKSIRKYELVGFMMKIKKKTKIAANLDTNNLIPLPINSRS
jgi:hypothetical protein